MMVKFTNKFLLITLVLASMAGINRAAAQDGTVNTNVITHDKDGVFNSTASYTFEANSTYTAPQTGWLKYIVTTEAGKKMKSDSVAVHLGSRGSASYNFDIGGLKAGFYKINFMINLTE